MDNGERIEKVKKALLAMQRYPWEQGVGAQAFLELGDTEWVVLMARDAVMRQSDDGRLGVAFYKDEIAIFGDDKTAADPAANGEAVLYAAKITGNKMFKDAAEKQVDWLLHKAPRTNEGILCHVMNKKQVWVDSIYMAMPFLSITGHIREAIRQIEGIRRLLWNPDKKLFSHIWDDEIKDFASKDCWGVGNGWAVAGITRVIKSLPEGMIAEKKVLAGYIKELIDSCIHHQHKDGLFHNVVDNPVTFIETNLAQMISYAIYSGVAGGWLDSEYLKAADKMREAVYKKVDELGLVQGVCGSPNFARPGTAVEGQAFFLLMEASASKFTR